MADLPPLVVDNGTGFVKCGFAADNFPTAIFPRLPPATSLQVCHGSDALAHQVQQNISCLCPLWPRLHRRPLRASDFIRFLTTSVGLLHRDHAHPPPRGDCGQSLGYPSPTPTPGVHQAEVARCKWWLHTSLSFVPARKYARLHQEASMGSLFHGIFLGVVWTWIPPR